MSSLDPFTKYNVAVAAETSAGYGPLASDYYMTMEDSKSLVIKEVQVYVQNVCHVYKSVIHVGTCPYLIELW